jgi:hypothetical protein
MMHILEILVFVFALIVAGEVIRSTLVASGGKIVAVLAGEAVEPVIGLTFSNHSEPASVIPITCAVRRRVVSRPVSLPLAA